MGVVPVAPARRAVEDPLRKDPDPCAPSPDQQHGDYMGGCFRHGSLNLNARRRSPALFGRLTGLVVGGLLPSTIQSHDVVVQLQGACLTRPRTPRVHDPGDPQHLAVTGPQHEARDRVTCLGTLDVLHWILQHDVETVHLFERDVDGAPWPAIQSYAAGIDDT